LSENSLETTAADRTKAPLSHVALLFLRLGLTAFGGPADHVAMMEGEVVRRRGWLTRGRCHRQASLTDRSQYLDTFGFWASVERFAFVVGRVANVGNDRNVCLPHLGQREQGCSLHLDR
jgi:hypothetical protein